jgi:sec-independent protein translocase protein TatA
MFGMGPQELLLFGVIAILLFGKKLPDIARKVGGGYRDFRKGMNEMKTSYRDTTSGYMDDVNSNYSAGSGYAEQEESGQGDYEEATAPRFEPPPVEPQVEQADPADESADPADEADSD